MKNNYAFVVMQIIQTSIFHCDFFLLFKAFCEIVRNTFFLAHVTLEIKGKRSKNAINLAVVLLFGRKERNV